MNREALLITMRGNSNEAAGMAIWRGNQRAEWKRLGVDDRFIDEQFAMMEYNKKMDELHHQEMKPLYDAIKRVIG